jgi:putative intracellular protease/amidase
MAETRAVGIYLFDDVEVLDFAGPFEVFSMACRVGLRVEPKRPKPFGVISIAGSIHAVSTRASLQVPAAVR